MSDDSRRNQLTEPIQPTRFSQEDLEKLRVAAKRIIGGIEQWSYENKAQIEAAVKGFHQMMTDVGEVMLAAHQGWKLLIEQIGPEVPPVIVPRAF